MTTRYDTATIGKIEQDADTGFIHIKDVPIARVGVFPYRRADGSVEMEAKLPSDLLADEAVASANNKAITDNHPSELVNAGNFSQYGKGVTADNAHVDGDRIRVDMTITDSDLIRQIADGKEELSIGFVTEVVPQSGDYQGVKYDSMQRNIQINHVAVVNRGRAGHSVRLTGDSAMMTDEGGTTMETTKVLLNGTNITVLADDADTVTKANSENSSLQDQLKTAKAKVASLEAEIEKQKGSSDANKKSAEDNKAKADSLEAENGKLTKQLENYKGDSIDEMVTKRMNLVEQAKPYLGDSFDIKGKSDREIKVAAIQAQNDGFDDKDRSDEYVDAFYDSMIELGKKSGVSGFIQHGDGADKLSELQESRYNLSKEDD